MNLFRRTKDKSQERKPNSTSQNQRVYTYYTASKSQIDKFERSNKARSGEDKSGALGIKLFGSKAITALAIFIIVIGTGFGLMALANPTIIFKDNTQYQSTDFYKQQISEIIKSDKRNLFKPTLQSSAVEAEIKQTIPEVTEVDVYAPIFGRGIVAKITTTQPFAVLIQQSGPSLIIDQTGKAVTDVSASNIDTAKLSTITNDSQINYNLADQVFKPEEMQALIELNYQLTEGNDKLISYNIPSVPREIRLERAGYFVKFSLDDSSGADIKIQYGSLISIETSIAKQGTQKPREYIDVRLGDKIYIK